MIRKTNIIYHLLGIILVLLIPSILFPTLIHSQSIPIAFIVKDTVLVAFLICFFYVHYHYIIPKMYNSKKYILYGTTIILIFAFISKPCALCELEPRAILYKRLINLCIFLYIIIIT